MSRAESRLAIAKWGKLCQSIFGTVLSLDQAQCDISHYMACGTNKDMTSLSRIAMLEINTLNKKSACYIQVSYIVPMTLHGRHNEQWASQITSLTIVYSTVYSGPDQTKHQSSASLAFVRGIHRGPVNSPHKWPVTWKMFSFDDVIMNKVHSPVWWMQKYSLCEWWT